METRLETKCSERVAGKLTDRMETMNLYLSEPDVMEEGNEDYPPFYEFGLSFDYVEPGTFTDQREGYFRYQLSWGGPSDEFRFFVNLDGSVHRVEYWFMDWFDGASVTLDGENLKTMEQVFDWITGGDISVFVN